MAGNSKTAHPPASMGTVLKSLWYSTTLPIKLQADLVTTSFWLFALKSIEARFISSSHPYASQIVGGVLAIREGLQHD